MSDPATDREPLAKSESATGTSRKISAIVGEWLRKLGSDTDPSEELGEDLAEAIEERREAHQPINAQERRMLMNLLRFGELKVADVMVPRADIVAIEASTPLPDLVARCREAGHSRLPIYRGTLDDTIGMLHIKDLFQYWGTEGGFALAPILRKALFVPPSMPLLDLLLKMQATRIHMALVVDEYGGIDGLATIEDVVEQIVGNIEDEHDIDEKEPLTASPDGSFEAEGRAPVELLERRLGVNLLDVESEEAIDTVAGLIYSLAGRVPVRGELIRHPAGVEFEVIEADPRRLSRVKIRLLRRDPSTTP